MESSLEKANNKQLCYDKKQSTFVDTQGLHSQEEGVECFVRHGTGEEYDATTKQANTFRKKEPRGTRQMCRLCR